MLPALQRMIKGSPEAPRNAGATTAEHQATLSVAVETAVSRATARDKAQESSSGGDEDNGLAQGIITDDEVVPADVRRGIDRSLKMGGVSSEGAQGYRIKGAATGSNRSAKMGGDTRIHEEPLLTAQSGGLTHPQRRRTASPALLQSKDETGGSGAYPLRYYIALQLVEQDLYASPSLSLREMIAEKLRRDAFAVSTLGGTTSGRSSGDCMKPGFTRTSNRLLAYRNRLYVPKDKGLRSAILERYYDDPSRGYYGVTKTLRLVSNTL